MFFFYPVRLLGVFLTLESVKNIYFISGHLKDAPQQPLNRDKIHAFKIRWSSVIFGILIDKMRKPNKTVRTSERKDSYRYKQNERRQKKKRTTRFWSSYVHITLCEYWVPYRSSEKSEVRVSRKMFPRVFDGQA